MKLLGKIRVIAGIIGSVISYVFLAGAAAVMALYLFGVRPYITMSGSMEPVIQTGSICFVDTNAEYSDVGYWDLVAYRAPTGTLVTHRVVSVTEEGLETKGDANGISDGISVTPDNFHGKTLFSVPYVGYAVKYLQQPKVIIFAIILLCGSFALNAVDARARKRAGEPAGEIHDKLP